MALNYFGAVHCTKAVVPRMAERRQGCVVLVASAMGVLGFRRVAIVWQVSACLDRSTFPRIAGHLNPCNAICASIYERASL